jgi:trk system potassium uptake protein TrkH
MKNPFKGAPLRILVCGYFLITALGAILLTLPISTADGSRQNIIDAFFLATSAISTSGLSVVDLGSYYSAFGQIVIMMIFQIGGLGYMGFFVFMIGLFRKDMSIGNRVVAMESVAGTGEIDLFEFFKIVLVSTFVFELMGAIFLFLCWMKDFAPGRAAYLSVFHSVSTFCTAGFSLFPNSLVSYRDSIPVNLTVSLLSLAGGIGFIVLYDLGVFLGSTAFHKKPRRLTTHSKMVLLVTVIVIATSFAVILITERLPAPTLKGKILAASFQAISASTTDGFNTIEIGALGPSALCILLLLMLIGAGPGSTGGGIKVSTLGVLVLSTWSFIRGKRDVNFQGRRITEEVIIKAFYILFLFIAIAVLDTLVLCKTEKFPFLPIVFEISSALGNTGLSTGITSSLTVVGKILITLTMFAGRIGPLTLGLSLLEKKRKGRYQYADARIYVG